VVHARSRPTTAANRRNVPLDDIDETLRTSELTFPRGALEIARVPGTVAGVWRAS